MTRLIFFTFLILGLSACQSSTVEIPADWESTSGGKWSLSFPPDWKVDPEGPKTHGVAIIHEIAGEDNVSVMEITVTINDFTGSGITLDEFVKAAEYKGASNLPEFSVQQTGNQQVGSLQARKLFYTTKIDGYLFAYAQYYLIEEENGIVLTFSSEEKYFKKHLKSAEKIFSTFQWSNEDLALAL